MKRGYDNMIGINEEKVKKIDRFITERMVDDKIPGLSLAIIDKDGIRYAQGYGSRRLKNNLPATVDTLYGIGSCTKSIAALAILQLVEKGVMGLDDLVSDHLPVDFGTNDVTVHHLLTHSSGMPSLAVSELLIDRLIEMDERGAPMGGLEDFYRHMNEATGEIAAEPGERFFYFNSGYSLIGELVRKMSGLPFEEYVRKNILSPLKMDRSSFKKERFEKDEDVMTPYFMKIDGPEPTAIPLRELGYAPGGLMSSVKEMANYLMMNINGGYFEEELLLESELLEKMHSPHIDRPNGAYGYGWSVEEFMGKKFVGHGGSIAVSTAYIGFNDEYGVAILVNTAPSTSPKEMAKACLSIALGRDWKEDVPYFKRQERMDRLIGEYHSYRGLKKAKIESMGGVLKLTFLERLEQQTLILIPQDDMVEEHLFYALMADGTREPVEFVVEDEEVDLYIGRWRLHKKS